MNPQHIVLSAWDWEPSVLIGCALLLAAYFWVVRIRTVLHAIYFVTGVLVMLLALVSPIDTLGDTYLFSVHMLQHLLLVLIVPPLLILGIPRKSIEQLLSWRPAAVIEHALSLPALAWSVAFLTMAAWHIPVLYNAALANEDVHIAQHLMFLVTATIFWWPVLTPIAALRMGTGATVIYLFAAAAANTVLGIVITFAPVGIYPAYLAPNDELNILPFIRKNWGMSPAADQQLGGLLMWVPGCSIYFLGILIAIIEWYSRPEYESAEILSVDNRIAGFHHEVRGTDHAR